MECDSMHSTIERKLNNREIYSPAQYVEICKTARLTKPYHVQYLQHTFFTKFSSMPYLRSIRPGNKTGDATVFELRCIQYRTDGTTFYKNVQNEDFVKLPKKIRCLVKQIRCRYYIVVAYQYRKVSMSIFKN